MKSPRMLKWYLKVIQAGFEIGAVLFIARLTIVTLAAFLELYQSDHPGHGNALFIVPLIPMVFYLGWLARRAFVMVRREIIIRIKKQNRHIHHRAPQKPIIYIFVDKPIGESNLVKKEAQL